MNRLRQIGFFFALLMCTFSAVLGESAYQQLIRMGGSPPSVPTPSGPQREGNDGGYRRPTLTPEERQQIEAERREARQRAEAKRREARLWAEFQRSEAKRKAEAAKWQALVAKWENDPLVKETKEAKNNVDMYNKWTTQAKTSLSVEESKKNNETGKTSGANRLLAESRSKAGPVNKNLEESKKAFENTWADDPGVIVLGDAAFSKPLAPRIIDKQFYDRAKIESEKLSARIKGIDERIENLKKWRSGDSKSLKEFEDIRYEAIWDGMSSLLSVIPVDDLAKSLGGVDKKKIAEVKNAITVLKGLTAAGESQFAPNADARSDKVIDSLNSAVEATREMLTVAMPDKERKTLEAVQNSLMSMQKIRVWYRDSGKNPTDKNSSMKLLRDIEPHVNGLIDVVGVWVKPVEMGQGIYKLGAAGATYAITSPTVASLKAAQADNWNAERFLKTKKVDLEEKRSELKMSAIDPYESMHRDTAH